MAEQYELLAVEHEDELRNDDLDDLRDAADDIGTDSRSHQKIMERIEQDQHRLNRYRFDADLEFEAGQFLPLTYEPADADEPISRFYSIASAPEDEELELYIGLKDDGALTPALFDELEEGDDVELGTPRGHFTLEDSDRDPVMIGVGTGIAPIKGMVDSYMHQHDLEETDDTLWIVNAASWEDELGYHDEFQTLDQQYDSIEYVPITSQEHKWHDDWDGETGRAQNVIKEYVDETGAIDPDTTEAYVCGSQIAVDQIKSVLLDDEPPEQYEGLETPYDLDHVHRENFG